MTLSIGDVIGIANIACGKNGAYPEKGASVVVNGVEHIVIDAMQSSTSGLATRVSRSSDCGGVTPMTLAGAWPNERHGRYER